PEACGGNRALGGVRTGRPGHPRARARRELSYKPPMQTELLELAIAIVVIALIMIVLRRASARSRQRAPQNVRERLGVEPEPTARPRRERKRPRPDEADVAAEAAATAPTQAPGAGPVEAPAAAEATDVEAREAYKAGLAKTRSGFVSRLGKLFGRKKIDAQTLDELEEVLFTADIGPRAADRIFQAVKAGLSKDELADTDKIWGRIRAT